MKRKVTNILNRNEIIRQHWHLCCKNNANAYFDGIAIIHLFGGGGETDSIMLTRIGLHRAVSKKIIPYYILGCCGMIFYAKSEYYLPLFLFTLY